MTCRGLQRPVATVPRLSASVLRRNWIDLSCRGPVLPPYGIDGVISQDVRDVCGLVAASQLIRAARRVSLTDFMLVPF